MEKKIRSQQAVIILLSVLLVINLFSIADMKEKIDNINFNISDRLQQIQSDINTIRYDFQNITDEIEDDIGLITSFDFSYGELDKVKMTVPVRAEIVPKNLTDNTSLFLEFAGRTVEMKKEDTSSAFVADFIVGLFEQKDDSYVRLVIKNGDFSETLDLEWSFGGLHEEFLPFITAHFIFSDITSNPKTGITVKGTVSGFIEEEEADRFSNVKLIFKLNGETLSEDPINAESVDRCEVNKTFPGYGLGDTFELYIEAEDNFGFIHERLLEKVGFSEDGTITEGLEPEGKGATIRDKDGNILYS